VGDSGEKRKNKKAKSKNIRILHSLKKFGYCPSADETGWHNLGLWDGVREERKTKKN
jgi:hypothetical protein